MLGSKDETPAQTGKPDLTDQEEYPARMSRWSTPFIAPIESKSIPMTRQRRFERSFTGRNKRTAIF